MRRMLDPKEAGGLPPTIEFDKAGNRKATKNLDVGGKLTLKSLVSNTNPDGDITKELGGGSVEIAEVNRIRGEIHLKYNQNSNAFAQVFLYRHFVKITKEGGSFVCFNVLHTGSGKFTSLSDAARAIGDSMLLAIGSIDGSQIVSVASISGNLTGYTPEGTSIKLEGYTIQDKVGTQGLY